MPYSRSLQRDLFESGGPRIQILPQDRAKLVALLRELLSEALAAPQAQIALKSEEEVGNE